MVTGWYDDALTEERLKEIEDDWLKQCGPHDLGLPEYACNCPGGDPRWVISLLTSEIKRLKEIEARMKGLEK